MRILLAGDTHGNTHHSKLLIDQAVEQNCDCVFVLGDWGFWEHVSEGIRFSDEVNEYSEAQNTPTYFLDGNHDKTSLLLEKYEHQQDEEGFLLVRSHVRYARRGHRWTWGGIRFISLGGAYSVDKDWRVHQEAMSNTLDFEDLWFPEEEMSDEDMDTFLTNQEHVHVMLAHDKPRGSSPGWNRKDLQECHANQNRLQKAVRTLEPLQFWHGHLHFPYGQQMDYSNLQGQHRNVMVRGLDCDPQFGGPGHAALGQSCEVLDTDLLLLELV